MKNNIHLNSKINLDELKEALQENFDSNELANFAVSLGSDFVEEAEYYNNLYKRLQKVLVNY